MTVDEQVFVGRTLDEARAQAAEHLRVGAGDLAVSVVGDEGGGGVTIRAQVDPRNIVLGFLAKVFRAGELDLEARVDADEGVLVGDLSGADLGVLTGGGGRGLDALQYLSNRVLNRHLHEHPPVHLDTNGFKERRARRLQDEAESAADEAVRTRRAVVLGPYTPAARREIHLALADDPAVETESDGEGFLKRVVIRPRRRR